MQKDRILDLPEHYVTALKKVIGILGDVEEVQELRLFGSSVHGTYHAQSDLDFLVVTTEAYQADALFRAIIREKVEDALSESNIECDVVFYTKEMLQEPKTTFEVELQKNVCIFRR